MSSYSSYEGDTLSSPFLHVSYHFYSKIIPLGVDALVVDTYLACLAYSACWAYLAFLAFQASKEEDLLDEVVEAEALPCLQLRNCRQALMELKGEAG